MKCIKYRPTAEGHCQLGRVTQRNCTRMATREVTTSGGKIVKLCERCFEKFGKAVGK